MALPKPSSRQKWIAAGVVLVLAVFVLVYFEPQKLFIDDVVDEGLPQAATQSPGEEQATEGTGSPRPDELAMGMFRPLAHGARGDAVILELANGDRYLRFENFQVENGPDLRVYLSASSEDEGFDADFVDLGGLKGNIGSQNYRVPSDVDLSKYSNAVVWCRQFSVGFAVAELG